MLKTPCFIYQNALKNPNKIAITENSTAITYEILHKRIQSTQSFLRENQIPSKLALICSPSISIIISLFACLRENITPYLVSDKLPLQSLHSLLEDLTCNTVLSKKPLALKNTFSQYTVEEISSISKPITNKVPNILFNTCLTLFSSGSTATPKALCLTYKNLLYNAMGSNQNIPLKEEDKWLLSLPIFHVSGLGILFRTLLADATVVIKTRSLTEVLSTEKITHLSLVPTQLKQLLESDLSTINLKAILLGGAKTPIPLLQSAIEKDLPVFTTYGLSEMGSQVCTTNTPLTKLKNNQYPCGKVLKYSDIKISNSQEVLVKGETLFQGYLTNTGLKKPFTQDGWFPTGDQGRLDNEGTLFITGRIDTMFISGGENIYPEEIELQLLSLPTVEKAVVIPYPHTKYGERPIAFVYTTKPFNEIEIKKRLSLKLPSFKVPDYILAWPDTVSTLKPNRHDLLKHITQNLDSILC